MLKWCSYCQQFMHEIAPYDDFGVTHGLCATCESSHEDLFSREEIERSLFLQIYSGRCLTPGEMMISKRLAELSKRRSMRTAGRSIF